MRSLILQFLELINDVQVNMPQLFNFDSYANQYATSGILKSQGCADFLPSRILNEYGLVVPVIKSENEGLVYLTDLVLMKVFVDKDLFHDSLIDSLYYP
jgi:hypothetical protein